ncbi:unnamed protein product [Caenorhabditis brenneri]
MFRNSSSNADRIEPMIHGTGEHVKKLLEQHRQMQPKSLQDPDEDVAPSNFCEGCGNHQPGKLLEGLQLQESSPGHSLALGEEENVLTSRAILTPEDYESGQRSSSTAANHSASEQMMAKSQYVETIDQISGITDNSSSINCQSTFTEKFTILETSAMIRNGDTSHRYANADSVVNDLFRSPITRSTKVSVLCQSEKPTKLEPGTTVEADEVSTEQTREEDSYLSGPSSIAALLCARSSNGHPVAMEYFEMRSPSVLTQQNMWISTDDQSSSTSFSNNVQIHDEMVNSSLVSRKIKAASKHKATRRLDHQQVRRNRSRRAGEAAAVSRIGRQSNKSNHRRLRGKREYNKGAELSVEVQAMNAFPGIPPQKAMEAQARREQAKVARAQSPIFIFDEQRIIMDNFEAENGQQLELADQLEHEEEVAGWMMDGGFGEDIDAGRDVAENDLLVMDGFGNQEDIELALMEGDDAFGNSSLALTPPQH